ncbi:MAG: hypothetical protein PHS54_00305 [Clostridia bacterium]|nr:hypothetical protein [Clostridia bacterium]
MKKTRDELCNELVMLEKQMREVKRTESNVKADFKDRKKDIENSIDGVLNDLAELDGGIDVSSI